MSRFCSYSVAEALERLKSQPGDEEAWTSLYHEFWPFVVSLMYRQLGGNVEAAEDASQEVFARLVRYKPFERIGNESALRAYMRQVCRNVANDYLARTLNMPELTRLSDREETELPHSNGALAQIEQEDLLRFLEQGLNTSEKRLLRLIAAGGSIRRISERMGLSYSATAVRIFRLRRKLTNILEKTREV